MALELVRVIESAEEAARKAVFALAPELPFDDIWTPIPEASLVVPALGICPGPAHLVTGSWYTGKTLFLMALGLAVASGRDLWGLYSVRRGLWAHMDHEMGQRSLKRYMQRLARGLGLLPDDLRGYMRLHPLPRLNLTTEGAVDHYCRLLEGVALCTIDPLRAAAPGQDENSSEFRQWLDMLATVSDRSGCSILVLHHGGKPVEGAARRNTGRGSSAIDDAVQSKFVLTAAEKGAPIQVSHEKTRELTQPLDDFWLRIENGDGAVRLVHLDPEQMTDELEERARASEREQLAKAVELIRTKLAAFQGQFRGSRAEFLGMVGGRKVVVSAALSRMMQEGSLRHDGRGEGGCWRLC